MKKNGCLLKIGFILSILMIFVIIRYTPFINAGIMYKENFVWFISNDVYYNAMKLVYSKFVMRLIYMILGIIAIVFMVIKMRKE